MISYGDLYHRVTSTQNRENLQAMFASKANQPTMMITTFLNR